MDDMDTGSGSASGSENRELCEEDVALSPPPLSELVNEVFVLLKKVIKVKNSKYILLSRTVYYFCLA